MYFDAKATGERIHQLRRERKMTQDQLSELLNISARNLRYIENGERSPSADILTDVALYFDISLDYLMTGKEKRQDEVKEEIQEAMRILAACMAKI